MRRAVRLQVLAVQRAKRLTGRALRSSATVSRGISPPPCLRAIEGINPTFLSVRLASLCRTTRCVVVLGSSLHLIVFRSTLPAEQLKVDFMTTVVSATVVKPLLRYLRACPVSEWPMHTNVPGRGFQHSQGVLTRGCDQRYVVLHRV
eukprot:4969831-Pyramimonas_sp.AAC.2